MTLTRTNYMSIQDLVTLRCTMLFKNRAKRPEVRNGSEIREVLSHSHCTEGTILLVDKVGSAVKHLEQTVLSQSIKCCLSAWHEAVMTCCFPCAILAGTWTQRLHTLSPENQTYSQLALGAASPTTEEVALAAALITAPTSLPRQGVTSSRLDHSLRSCTNTTKPLNNYNSQSHFLYYTLTSKPDSVTYGEDRTRLRQCYNSFYTILLLRPSCCVAILVSARRAQSRTARI